MADCREKRLLRMLRALKSIRQTEKVRLHALQRDSQKYQLAQKTAIRVLNEDAGLHGQATPNFADFYARQIRKNSRDEKEVANQRQSLHRKVVERQGQEKIMEDMINRLNDQNTKDQMADQLSDVVERYSGKLPASKT